MTTRDHYHLRGPVHTCQIQRNWRSTGTETNERSDTTSLEFRPDGLLAHQRHRNPDGSEWTNIHDYDQAGRLSQIRTENSAEPVSLTFHEYDTAGRLARVFSRHDGTDEHDLETHEYDAQGCKSKTRLADPRISGWSVEGSNTAYPSRGATKVVTRYNQRDQPCELLFHDLSGHLLSRVDFRYDPHGHLIEETQTEIAAAMSPELSQEWTAAQLEAVRALFGSVHQLHTCDQQGRRVRTHVRIGRLSDETTTRTYNVHGDEIEVISENTQWGYNLDDKGKISETPADERVTRSETMFRYDYDTRGNWTMKAIQSPGGELSTLERRTITYFSEGHNETPGDPIRSPQDPAHDPKNHP